MEKRKIRALLAIISIALIVVAMVLFARFSASVTMLNDLNQQKVIINIFGENTGDIEVNVNNESPKKEELIKNIVESLLGMIVSIKVSVITRRFALTGKWIVKKE